MGLSEADTQAKLVNPRLYARGWTEDHIMREETTGAVEMIAGKARRRTKGRTDLTLRVVVTAAMQPVAVAVIEVKRDTLPPDQGLDQGKAYARAKRLNVPFVFATNGRLSSSTTPPLARRPSRSRWTARLYFPGRGRVWSS
jgi:type I restriction enzyme R subunit